MITYGPTQMMLLFSRNEAFDMRNVMVERSNGVTCYKAEHLTDTLHGDL